MPFLPGAATPTEAMRLLDRGYRLQRFFPAAAGGPAALSALSRSLPQVRFCAAGGIAADRAPAYLATRNTVCIAADWIAPRDLVAARNRPAIRALAAGAAGLRPALPGG